MPSAYSNDLRVRVIETAAAMGSARQAARLFMVSASTAIKWVQADKYEGRRTAKPVRGHPPEVLAPYEDWLATRLAASSDINLAELQAELIAPHGYWKVATFIAGLRLSGIVAPLVLDCPMNSEIFRQYSEVCLLPELSEGDIVVLDNLSSHKASGVREMIEAKGAILKYLLPYSPDLNPIEQAISKIKAHMRTAAARNFDAICQNLGRIIDTFTQQECKNFLTNSGYA